jgi:hypothetical protein
MHLIPVGYVILYAALDKALPFLDGDEAVRRTALSLQALCEDRLGIARRRPSRAERGRRYTSEEERYRHE